MTLTEMVAQYGHGCNEVPRQVVSRDGDFIAIILSGDLYYTERVDEFLTVHIAFDGKHIVGCTIKGLSIISKFMVEIDADEIELELVLITALGLQDGHSKNVARYLSTANASKPVRIPKRMFEPAC